MDSRLIETGVNGRGVLLADSELDLLYLLYQQRYLTLKQMYKFIKLKSNIKENSFRNRINKKFVMTNMVIPKEYSLGRVGFMFKYYRIGNKGLQVLHDMGIISEEEMNSYRDNFNTIRNVEHYLATQEIVTECVKECIKSERSYRTYSKGMTIFHNGMTSKIQPDWIVETEDMVIYFELDTGTETLKEVKDKVDKYRVMFNASSSKKLVLLIVELDESFLTRYALGSKIKRIANMKSGLVNLFHETNVGERVYVFGLERAMEFIPELVNKELAKRDAKISELQNTALMLEMFHQDFPYTISKVNLEIPINGPYEFYEFVHKKSREQEIYVFYYGEEGDIETSNDLFHLNNMVSNNQLPNNCRNVICFYRNEDSLIKEVPASTYKHIIFANIDKWANELQHRPSYRKQINQFTWEVRELV